MSKLEELLKWVKERSCLLYTSLPVGIALGVLLIELSLPGAIIGGVMALAQMGLYDVIKPMLTGGPKINTHNGI